MNIEKNKKNFLEGNKGTIESLAALFAIVGILLSVSQHFEQLAQQQNNREEKAFELYKQFNEGYFIAARNELKKEVYETKREIYYKDLSAEDYIEAMLPHWTDKNKYVKIISITNFFEQVVTCVNKKLCDEEATMALFGKEAADFLGIHHPFFCMQRIKNRDHHIAAILERYVARYLQGRSGFSRGFDCFHVEGYLKENDNAGISDSTSPCNRNPHLPQCR